MSPDHRTQRLREAASSRSFHLKSTTVLRDLGFEPYTFVASATTAAAAESASGGGNGSGGDGDGEEGWDDWGEDEAGEGVRKRLAGSLEGDKQPTPHDGIQRHLNESTRSHGKRSVRFVGMKESLPGILPNHRACPERSVSLWPQR